jgi:hypothetical protein
LRRHPRFSPNTHCSLRPSLSPKARTTTNRHRFRSYQGRVGHIPLHGRLQQCQRFLRPAVCSAPRGPSRRTRGSTRNRPAAYQPECEAGNCPRYSGEAYGSNRNCQVRNTHCIQLSHRTDHLLPPTSDCHPIELRQGRSQQNREWSLLELLQHCR